MWLAFINYGCFCFVLLNHELERSCRPRCIMTLMLFLNRVVLLTVDSAHLVLVWAVVSFVPFYFILLFVKAMAFRC